MKIKMLMLSFITVFILISMKHSVLADETSTWQPKIEAPNPLYSQRMNERGGRNGTLIITGSLVTSPCRLNNNEILLNKDKTQKGDGKVEILLSGCGDGAKYTAPIYADIYSQLVAEPEFISVYQHETGITPPTFELVGGDNLIYIYFSDYQKKINLEKSNDTNKDKFNDSTLLLKVKYQ